MGLISRVSSRTYRNMSTAHRPTWDAAKAGTKRAESDLGKLSLQWSSRDAPSHTKLKVRSVMQTKTRTDLKRQLEDKEKTAARNALKNAPENAGLDDEEIEKKRLKFEDLDRDDPVDSESDDDSDSDEDDTDELLAELAKIKAERAAEEEKKRVEELEKNERLRSEKILHANPFMDIAGKLTAGDSDDAGFTVKRRWDDDVVFKNCAKSEEHKEEKRFVNDTLRSDFHRRFIERYFSNGSNFISP